MSVPAHEATEKWFAEEFTSLLSGIFETMAGERPAIEFETKATGPGEATLRWRQPFSGIDGGVWIAAGEKDWKSAAGHVLRAAGIEDGDDATLKSTFLESVGQALSGMAQKVTSRIGREVLPDGGQETAAGPADAAWISLHIRMNGDEIGLALGIEPTIFSGLAESSPVTPVGNSEVAVKTDSVSLRPESKTFDLLLEVELPVSVSFGRAQVPLKDVLKLTTGSVVELNRSVSEPVEIIVNNCVIARGEVVVVEGNFGVRIQHVISKQERLRTLN